MVFDWGSAKNARNIEKHGIGFATAAQIFDGPVLTAEDRRRDYGERRMNSIGRIAGLAVVVVTHTDRAGVTRIISARRASRAERGRYEQALHTGTQPG